VNRWSCQFFRRARQVTSASNDAPFATFQYIVRNQELKDGRIKAALTQLQAAPRLRAILRVTNDPLATI
jgi:hypothetical protein